MYTIFISNDILHEENWSNSISGSLKVMVFNKTSTMSTPAILYNAYHHIVSVLQCTYITLQGEHTEQERTEKEKNMVEAVPLW